MTVRSPAPSRSSTTPNVNPLRRTPASSSSNRTSASSTTAHRHNSKESGGTAKDDLRSSSTSNRQHQQTSSEIICRVKYSNTLPDLPFDTKFLSYPFEKDRFVVYAANSTLERGYKYDVLTEADLGVEVDLILPETYDVKSSNDVSGHNESFDEFRTSSIPLDPEDEALLMDDVMIPAHGGGGMDEVPSGLPTSSSSLSSVNQRGVMASGLPSSSSATTNSSAKKTALQMKARSERHAKMLSWMRRPDYISTEQTRFQPQTIDKVEAKVGFSSKRKKMVGSGENETGTGKYTEGSSHTDVTDHGAIGFMDRDTQIKAIEKTFEDATIPLDKMEHYSGKKPGVHPVEVMSVLPDDTMWKFPCAQVIFDSDPAPSVASMQSAGVRSGVSDDPNALLAHNELLMSQAMIRGVMDESGEQFVAYFLPTPKTLELLQENSARDDDVEKEQTDDDTTYEYKMFREYNWNVKSKANKGYEENYFFVARNDGFMYYNELETRVRLSKRRTAKGSSQINSKLVVQNRPLSKQELKMQRYRDNMLLPHHEEEEEQEDDDEGGGEESDDGDAKDGVEDRRSRSKSPATLRSPASSSRRSSVSGGGSSRSSSPVSSQKSNASSKVSSRASSSSPQRSSSPPVQSD